MTPIITSVSLNAPRTKKVSLDVPQRAQKKKEPPERMSFRHFSAEDDTYSSDVYGGDDDLYAALEGLGEGHYPGQYVYDDESYDSLLYPDERVLSRRHPGYTLAELYQGVTFSRPGGDHEGKDVMWCLDNGFREIQDGVWSGNWHPDYPGPDEERDTELSRRSRDLKKSLQTLVDRNVDPPTFEEALSLKAKGNSLFCAKQYRDALTPYTQAKEKLGGIGMILSGDQRAEMVTILSNEAECYLRLKWYTEAQMSATSAIALDGKHVKSLLRRAKATLYGSVYDDNGINPFACAQVEEDLEKIIRMNDDGVEEASKLQEEMRARMQKETDRLRVRPS